MALVMQNKRPCKTTTIIMTQESAVVAGMRAFAEELKAKADEWVLLDLITATGATADTTQAQMIAYVQQAKAEFGRPFIDLKIAAPKVNVVADQTSRRLHMSASLVAPTIEYDRNGLAVLQRIVKAAQTKS